jgi:glycosyltransferase involved in cell wall biosynthesis
VSPAPFFSIIMPVYNRQRFVGRAIESCLAQDFADFEVVAADDASTDRSREVIEDYRDPRVRLVRSETNRGRGPARNLAMGQARGTWFLFLDSDDELLPGSLAAIRERIARAAPNVGAFRFMCRTIEGEASPEPPHDGSLCNYETYLRWMERSVTGARQESMPCVRADTFPAIRYPEGHAEEALYHLDVARAVDVQLEPDVVRIYHHDAPDQVTRPQRKRLIQFAPDCARAVDDLLLRHGPSLERCAPGLAALFLAEGAAWQFLSGRRRAGFRYALAYGRTTGDWMRIGPVMILGAIGPQVLAWGKAMRAAMARRKW